MEKPMGKTAFITGIAGQDGSYLAEYLKGLGYKVTGIVRRNSVVEHQKDRLSELLDIEFMYGDVLDPVSVNNALASFIHSFNKCIRGIKHIRELQTTLKQSQVLSG